jgi:hypothetical protein
MLRPLFYFQVFLAFASFSGLLSTNTQTIKLKFLVSLVSHQGQEEFSSLSPPGFPLREGPIFVHSQGQSLCFLLYFKKTLEDYKPHLFYTIHRCVFNSIANFTLVVDWNVIENQKS